MEPLHGKGFTLLQAICRSRGPGTCKAGGHWDTDYCLPSLESWGWVEDGSVKPLDDEQAAELVKLGVTVNADELHGQPFEMTGPPPPHALAGKAGLYATAEVLDVLTNIGVQTNPSQGMHVHVNVRSDKAPGDPLSVREICRVFVGILLRVFCGRFYAFSAQD